MRVSELAKRAGISSAAIRFYESEGVLPEAPRSDNGYRTYGEDDLCRLRMVVTLRGLGIELSESGRLAALCVDGRCDDMQAQLIVQIEERRREVARARAELDHLDRELANREAELRSERSLPVACCQEVSNGHV
jgi:MerR family copper efflux transcriptional regulator